MTYELAKQLKDAGFPQKGMITPEDMAYSPTLSELIEACGEKFEMLSRFNGCKPEFQWEATGLLEGVEMGKSPEEAVAKLWLELTKK